MLILAARSQLCNWGQVYYYIVYLGEALALMTASRAHPIRAADFHTRPNRIVIGRRPTLL